MHLIVPYEISRHYKLHTENYFPIFTFYKTCKSNMQQKHITFTDNQALLGNLSTSTIHRINQGICWEFLTPGCSGLGENNNGKELLEQWDVGIIVQQFLLALSMDDVDNSNIQTSFCSLWLLKTSCWICLIWDGHNNLSNEMTDICKLCMKMSNDVIPNF